MRLVMSMGMRAIIRLFEQGNVSVDGLRGCGKDMLFSNVIARRKSIYLSNSDYHCMKSPFIKLQLTQLDPHNNYKNLISDNIVPYDYPYPEGADIYVSDAGIYFPSQYCSELNKQYPNMPVFQALSRHLGNCNFHFNTQNLNRVWDKIREQSDIYIHCNWCKVLFGKFVIQSVTVYSKYQSCLDVVEPYRHIRIPLMSKAEARATLRAKDEELSRLFRQQYGSIVNHLLIYKNKSKYDTRFFKNYFSKEN